MPDAKIAQIKELSRLLAVVLIFMSVAYIALMVMLENMGAYLNVQREFLTQISAISTPLGIVVSAAGLVAVLWLAANMRRVIDGVLLVIYRFVNRVI